MTEQPTNSAPDEQAQVKQPGALGVLRRRIVTLIVVVALAVGAVVGVIAIRLLVPRTGSPAAAAESSRPIAGLAGGQSGRIGPWLLTLSDYATMGDREVVTVSAQNIANAGVIDKTPADLAKLRFFMMIRDDHGDGGGSSLPHMIDCAPEDGSPLPRTGFVDPGATVTGRVCLRKVGGGPINVPLWAQISAYVADPELVQGNAYFPAGKGDSNSGSSLFWTITDIRNDGPDTRITSVIAAAPPIDHPDWLLASAAVDSFDTATQECQPGTAVAPVPKIAETSPRLIGVTSELCIRGTFNGYKAGFFPRVFWDFPHPTLR
ncbi:hypothetical protein [Nocardia arthritidis]|uniref:Uncharacterized protein n=1 Tax=Nocardia arthritidis TaxID=228602 RepID=A0A6G9YBB1_9NOCA|nr:hypothetical protein [Nocardia arthritidis]QIS10555.1 hypothetical protein F5544_13330 [Nocardia arthritidis]